MLTSFLTLIFMCSTTIDYYDQHSESYANECGKINIEETYKHFLPHLKPQDTILDAGCGPGRDSCYFLKKGFNVIAFDGSISMAKIAKKNTGLDVLHLDFLNFTLNKTYNAIWASCSLLHVPKAKIVSVMNSLCSKLTLNGLFYFSFKLGSDEVKRNSRLYCDYNRQKIHELIAQTPCLHIIDQWVSDDLSNPKLPKIIHTIARKREQ